MYSDIIGTQQILITLAFLGAMIALLIILRRKSVVIRANLKSGKRIDVIEDRAISPTERLRIVAVDKREFVLLSAKGQAPQLVALDVKQRRSRCRPFLQRRIFCQPVLIPPVMRRLGLQNFHRMLSVPRLPQNLSNGGRPMQPVKRRRHIGYAAIFTSLWLMVIGTEAAFAQDLTAGFAGGLPALISSNGADGSTSYSLSLQILALMTALTILPSLVLGMTSFTRIIIVLSILRQAMGTQQTPPNQVLIAIALFLTFFIMSPTLTSVYNGAAEPYLDGKISAEVALDTASEKMKVFMVQNTRKKDIGMFMDMAAQEAVEEPKDIPLSVLLPAFITSELKTAFQIGFLLFLPFLVIDMVVASVLMSLGMMMISPMLVALPFKLLLFVLVDGWTMTVGSLVSTYVV